MIFEAAADELYIVGKQSRCQGISLEATHRAAVE